MCSPYISDKSSLDEKSRRTQARPELTDRAVIILLSGTMGRTRFQEPSQRGKDFLFQASAGGRRECREATIALTFPYLLSGARKANIRG
jgi:hypothetical protein